MVIDIRGFRTIVSEFYYGG